MELFEVAISALIYDRFTDFGDTFGSFQEGVGGALDLSDKSHRLALLKWLNQWQCRQFSKECHPLASREILAWYRNFDHSQLPSGKGLLQIGTQAVDFAAAEYGRLVSRTASKRRRNGAELVITIGPTGASKILFAMRPKSMVPWDEAMRKGLKYDGSPESYRDFLLKVRSDLAELQEACKREGFAIDRLPAKLERPTSTPAQLVGEYYYLTETRGLSNNDFERARSYASWSQ